MSFEKENNGSSQLIYNVIDEVIESFHADDHLVRGIRAARGTGKSMSCLIELYLKALSMPPQKDGVRRSRFLITRTIYQDLKDTALSSWVEKMANVYGVLPVSGGGPWTSGIKMPLKEFLKTEVFTIKLVESCNKKKI